MNATVNSYRVTAANGEITIRGDTRQPVFVGLNSFIKKLPREPTPRAVDLLMIAAGVYAIDRILPRHSRGRAQHGIRTFDISFEVQDPLFWSQPSVSDIDLYESGVGAINLPLMTGMLFGGRSSRGAHPSFLAKMSELGALIADRAILFSLPYRDFTKGEMLEKVRNFDIAPWIQQSRSCVHTSLRTPHVTHCGVCPACIERRQAFAAARINEDPSPYMLDAFRDALRGRESEYLALLVEESTALIADDPRVLRRLKAHMATTEIDSREYDRVFHLVRRHAEEVCRIFRGAQMDHRVEDRLEDEAEPQASVGVAS